MASACLKDPTEQPTPTEPKRRFVEVAVQAGVDHLHWQEPEGEKGLQCGYEYMAAGAAAADFDDDGRIDLFVTRLSAPDLLYRNIGGGHFEEIASVAGVGHVGLSSAAAWADVDGDGDLDLYVSDLGNEPNRLYINQGGGRFAEEANARGVTVPVPTEGACRLAMGVAFGDADGDGDLDLMTSQWFHKQYKENRGELSRLFLNDGKGFFRDVTSASGILLRGVSAFSPSFADIDADGDQDLLIVGDWMTSRLFINQGKARFVNKTIEAGVGSDENGMGSALGDVDGDGDLDWFISAISDLGTDDCEECSGNRMYINDGAGRFSDRSESLGLRDGFWGWGAALFDLENDGDQDLAMTSGFDPKLTEYGRIMARGRYAKTPMRLWENEGSAAPWPERSQALRFIDQRTGIAVVRFDYDNDGDQDLFVTNNGDHPALFRNDYAQGCWLRVRVRGPAPNTHGVGARIQLKAKADGPTLHRVIMAGSNFMNQHPLEAHFGLGDSCGVLHELRIFRPGVDVPQILSNVDSNRVLTVNP